MATRLQRFLQGFRLVTGDALNQMIDAINNIQGNGTPDAVALTSEIYGLATLTQDGAIAPSTPASYVITKAGVLAATLAAPVVGTDDGKVILITSNTASAHTLTATGLLQTGTAFVNVATFAAQKGAGLTLMAYQGKWNVLGSVGITFS